MNNYLTSHDKGRCCGCSACVQICPVKCINFQVDDEGFWYPTVNKESCINCNKCSNVCPMELKNRHVNEPTAIYAGVIRNDNILMNSSSGGIFSAVAEYVLDSNGVVCGCILDNEHQVKHIIINDKNELAQLRGSKYVQSDMRNIYSNIKEILENGSNVLFVGTPCQVAGLKLFMDKSTKGLITIDLICHGVPSQMFLNKWVEYEETTRKTKIKNIKFREKEKYGWGHIISYETKSKKKVIQPPSINSFYYAYLNALNYRETCYECPFTTTQRNGDLTIADFWGIEKEKISIDEKKGVSMIIVNTDKGNEILQSLHNMVSLYSCGINNIVQRQTQLSSPVQRPKCRDDIYHLIEKISYNKVQKKYLRSKNYPYYLLASKTPSWLRDLIKK